MGEMHFGGKGTEGTIWNGFIDIVPIVRSPKGGTERNGFPLGNRSTVPWGEARKTGDFALVERVWKVWLSNQSGADKQVPGAAPSFAKKVLRCQKSILPKW